MSNKNTPEIVSMPNGVKKVEIIKFVGASVVSHNMSAGVATGSPNSAPETTSGVAQTIRPVVIFHVLLLLKKVKLYGVDRYQMNAGDDNKKLFFEIFFIVPPSHL